jgi:hypothetical protein
MTVSVITTVTKIIAQPGMVSLTSSYTLSGIQNPNLETTVNASTNLTISDGIGSVSAGSLNMLYFLSDGLDATVKFYSAAAGGGIQVGTTITLIAGVPYEWDSLAGTGPLGASAALSMVVAVGDTVNGQSSVVAATNIRVRSSFTA